MPSAFGNFLIAQHEERPLYHVHMVTSRLLSLIKSKNTFVLFWDVRVEMPCRDF